MQGFFYSLFLLSLFFTHAHADCLLALRNKEFSAQIIGKLPLRYRILTAQEKYLGQTANGRKVIIRPETRVVFRAGEQRVEFVSRPEAEVAYYLLSQILNLPISPPTFLTTLPIQRTRRTVSVQEWIEDSHTYRSFFSSFFVRDIYRLNRSFFREIIEDQQHHTPSQRALQLSAIWLVDLLSSHTDRHGRNLVVSPNGRIYAIDNGTAFRTGVRTFEANGETRYHEYALPELSSTDIALLSRSLDLISTLNQLTPETINPLRGLLNSSEIERVFKIRQRLLNYVTSSGSSF